MIYHVLEYSNLLIKNLSVNIYLLVCYYVFNRYDVFK